MEAFQKLGIDGWSMLLYLANTGLLLVLLTKLLYRPLLAVLDERRETIRRNLNETELLKQRFTEETKQREQETRASMDRLQSELLLAKEQAESRVKALLAEAEKDRDALLEKGRAQIETEKGRLLKDLENESRRRIERTILFVLKNRIPEATVRSSVEDAWKELYG